MPKPKTRKMKGKKGNVNEEGLGIDLTGCPGQVSSTSASFVFIYGNNFCVIDRKFQYKKYILDMQKEVVLLKANNREQQESTDTLQAESFLDDEGLAFLNSLSTEEGGDNDFVNKILPMVYGEDELKKRERKKTIQFIQCSPQYKWMKSNAYILHISYSHSNIFLLCNKLFQTYMKSEWIRTRRKIILKSEKPIF